MSQENEKLIVPQGQTLYPFQEDTVRRTTTFLKANSSHACYVANECGLGKSVTSLVTFNTLHLSTALIVCPAVMRLVWRDEIYKWCGRHQNISVISSGADLKEQLGNFIIISYSLASTKEAQSILSQRRFDILVLDEAQCVKNYKAKRTKAVFDTLYSTSTYRLFLSGTPMTRHIVDCYTAFHSILPEAFPTFKDFAERYSYKRLNPFSKAPYPVYEYFGLKNSEELSKIIRANFYIRYKKQEVLTELPPMSWQRISLPVQYSVELGNGIANTLFSEFQAAAQKLLDGKMPAITAHMATHRHAQGVKKAAAVAEFAKGLLEQEIPVCIFAHHKNVVETLRELLKDYGVPQVITGETPEAERKLAVERFESGISNLFIGNIQAAGVGISMPRCQHVVLAEMSYSPADNMQAVSRCHRVTSKGQVTVYYFIVQDSIDEAVEGIVARKSMEFNLVLDSA